MEHLEGLAKELTCSIWWGKAWLCLKRTCCAAEQRSAPPRPPPCRTRPLQHLPPTHPLSSQPLSHGHPRGPPPLLPLLLPVSCSCALLFPSFPPRRLCPAPAVPAPPMRHKPPAPLSPTLNCAVQGLRDTVCQAQAPVPCVQEQGESPALLFLHASTACCSVSALQKPG